MTQIMKIEKIWVNKLFGFLNHQMDLKEEGVTFIHGPNGCGKTTILKMVASFFSWQEVGTLFEINFGELVFIYDNKDEIRVTKLIKGNENNENDDSQFPVLNIILKKESGRAKSFEISAKQARKVPLDEVDDEIPFLTRVGIKEWVDMRNRESLSYAEVLKKFAAKLARFETPPEWLQEYQESNHVCFIPAQRLFKLDSEGFSHRSQLLGDNYGMKEMIQLYSDELKNSISNTLTEFAAISQSRDRSFPDRLLSAPTPINLSDKDIKDKYKEMDNKISKLMNAGLIDEEKNISLPQQKLEETEKKVLFLYLQDREEKLKIFEGIQKKIEVLMEIVVPKLRNKRFKVNRHEGFVFETTIGEQDFLKPTVLSSGEQNQIVLFYELIFNSKEPSLFLIDEPEISLHVEWQRQFFNDVSKVANLTHHSFLIATHSPQIIGSRRDIAIGLEGGILNE
jgi:predicted ATP-binding protein involved in virulence